MLRLVLRRSALSAIRLKEKLRKMTGTEVIRINDRHYTEHICRILQKRTKVSIYSRFVPFCYRATRMHSADYAAARCLSVCMSHTGIVPKRLYISSKFSTVE